MYCNQELLSVLDLYLLTMRNRSQFAFHGSVAACLNVLFKHCLWVERTLSNSRLQTYRILHDNLSKIWNTFFCVFDLEASELGQKCSNGKKCSNRKLRGSKRVGAKMFKREEMLQPEAKKKRASWVKNTKPEEMLQPEAKKK